MSVDSLGRAENLDKFLHQSNLSRFDGEIELELSDGQENVSPIDEVSGYPYSGQHRYHGKFDYKFKDWKGNEQNETGEFEYRAQSGLFMLSMGSERVNVRDILEKINSRIPEESEIKGSLSVRRKSLWDFFGEANQYDEVIIRGPRGQFDFQTLKHMAKRINSGDLDELKQVSEAKAQQEFRDPEKVESVVSLLDDLNLSDEINSLSDLGIDRSKYFIERADVDFMYKSELISVQYDRGELNITEPPIDNSEPDNETKRDYREYIVQLFETKVVYPSYGK